MKSTLIWVVTILGVSAVFGVGVKSCSETQAVRFQMDAKTKEVEIQSENDRIKACAALGKTWSYTTFTSQVYCND